MKRVVVVAVVAAVVAAAAIFFLRPESGVPEGAPTQDVMAAEIGSDVMRHLHRGHVPARSGEIMLVPKPHVFLYGNWELSTRILIRHRCARSSRGSCSSGSLRMRGSVGGGPIPSLGLR